MTRDDVVRRLRPLLDLPVELVLPAHGEPTDRAALERVLFLSGALGERLGLGSHRRIVDVPFTLRNIKEDLEDIGSGSTARRPGVPLGDRRARARESGLSYQRVPPGYRFPYGHTHETQEEVYVVVRGSGRMKLDDEIVELEEWDAVRVPPGTWRGYEAGPEGLEILVIGAPSLGEDRREDVDGQRDWWADE